MPYYTGIAAIVENLVRAENDFLDTDERVHIRGVRTLRSAREDLENWLDRETKAEMAKASQGRE